MLQLCDWIFDQKELDNLDHTVERSQPRNEHESLERNHPSNIILFLIILVLDPRSNHISFDVDNVNIDDIDAVDVQNEEGR